MAKVRYIGTTPILRGKIGSISENRGHISLNSGNVYLVSFDDPALPIYGRSWNISARHLVPA